MSFYTQVRKRSRSHRHGFTVIEMSMVIVAVAIMFIILQPTATQSLESRRIAQCQDNMRAIAGAMYQYVSDNDHRMPQFSWTDWEYKNWLDVRGLREHEYQANYNYRNLLGKYLDLGDCMPGEGNTKNWGDAAYSRFPIFRCPSGERSERNSGTMATSFYLQNCDWEMFKGRHTGPDGTSWPMGKYAENVTESPTTFKTIPSHAISAEMTQFDQPSQALLLYERWDRWCPIPHHLDPSDIYHRRSADPYSTHFRTGPGGAVGVGRSVIYADFHVDFLPCGSDQPVQSFPHNPQYTQRGNEELWYDWTGSHYEGWNVRYELLERS